ncbi:hypothetical protein [Salinigranum halophilum]|jgi:hypothetical protein|uniref:hypothetical protein n=1 Tax=Salinigranum halophilum TaxID=2565931 RepID=UPI00191BEA5F|nr:hypothetical protein [Salinigranum halophilum]
MSISDRTRFEHATRTAIDGVDDLQRFGSALVEAVVDAVRAVAFWLAALLPLSYLPLLATGVVAEHPFGFVALLASNTVAFVLGHTHRPEAVDAEC